MNVVQIYTCPYIGMKCCPLTHYSESLFVDNRVVIDSVDPFCELSPVVYIADPKTRICCIKADMDDPAVKDSIKNLGKYVYFQKGETDV